MKIIWKEVKSLRGWEIVDAIALLLVVVIAGCFILGAYCFLCYVVITAEAEVEYKLLGGLIIILFTCCSYLISRV